MNTKLETMQLKRLNYKSARAVRKNRAERTTWSSGQPAYDELVRRWSRRDDEEISHAMRFLGTDNPQQAILWLAEQARASD